MPLSTVAEELPCQQMYGSPLGHVHSMGACVNAAGAVQRLDTEMLDGEVNLWWDQSYEAFDVDLGQGQGQTGQRSESQGYLFEGFSFG